MNLTVLAVVFALDTNFLALYHSVTMRNAACFFQVGQADWCTSLRVE